MAGLRTGNPFVGAENETSTRLANTKGMGLRATRGRAAMLEIGNQGALKPVNNIVKPARMMVKQKATTSLRAAAAPPKPLVADNGVKLRRKRKCETVKPMEVDPPSEDVEMMEVDEPVVAFSADNLVKFNIENIDAEDEEDPQLVVQYVNEIYVYMRQLEAKQAIKKEYLKGKSAEVLPKMRAVLVDWMVGVHQQFTLLQETLYLAVAILDRYMSLDSVKLSRKQLQLIGVTSLFIAAKYEEMYPPEIGDFVYITDNAYNQSQIREMEMVMMAALKYDFGRPLPLHFLRRNSKAAQVDATAHTMAKYVMELTLLEHDLVHILPSEIAAASLAFALKTLDQENKTLNELWTPTIAYFSQYDLADIRSTLQTLAGVVKRTSTASDKAKIMSIRKKYSHKKFGRIAEFPELTSHHVEELQSGEF